MLLLNYFYQKFFRAVRKSCVYLFETLVMVEQYRSIVVNQMMNVLATTQLRDLSAGYFASQKIRNKNFDKWLSSFLFDEPNFGDRTSAGATIFACDTDLWSEATNKVGISLLLSTRSTYMEEALDKLGQKICPGIKVKT